VLLSFGLLWLGRSSLVGLGVAVVVLDFGVQANHISNQTVVLGLSNELRNRVNTVYMVGYFAGGAIGSTLGAWAWASSGWSGVCLAGAACALAALAVWRFTARNRR